MPVARRTKAEPTVAEALREYERTLVCPLCHTSHSPTAVEAITDALTADDCAELLSKILGRPCVMTPKETWASFRVGGA